MGSGELWLSSSNTCATSGLGQQNNTLTLESSTTVSGLTFKANGTNANIKFVTGNWNPLTNTRLYIAPDGKVAVGNMSPTSTFSITGSLEQSIVTKTTDYTFADDYTILLDGSSNAVVGTLPDATTCFGRTYVIKAINVTNQVSLATTNSQTIDESTSYYFGTRYDTAMVQSDGSNWLIIGEKRYDKLNRILI